MKQADADTLATSMQEKMSMQEKSLYDPKDMKAASEKLKKLKGAFLAACGPPQDRHTRVASDSRQLQAV